MVKYERRAAGATWHVPDGKLGALHALVPTDREVALPFAPPVPDAGLRHTERAEFAALRQRSAILLERQADDIAARWEVQVRTLLPDLPDAVSESSRTARAAATVRSYASSLASDGGASDEAVALGLAFGTAAFRAGAMLHHLLRALDLLEAMCLYVIEAAATDEVASAPTTTAGVADGVRFCRRLQRATSMVALAAARGYAQAAAAAAQERFRRLRHDMRNPLSTIRSALELMADETVPEEARRSPRFRAMIERNATTLDRMIVTRLGDAEARSPAGAYQHIVPRAVACAVRRDLRADIESRDVSLVVGNSGDAVRMDAAGLELLLHDALLAALHEATPGDVLTVEFPHADAARVALTLTATAGQPPIASNVALERLTALAAALGAWLTVERDRVTLAFPVVPDERTATASAPVDRGEASDDVTGPRQREDGQPRPL